MKKQAPILYELVQSLNSNEKRFFRKYAHRHFEDSKSYYLKVFDEMLKQKVYSERKIKLKLTAEGSKYGSHLSTIYNYLYNQILDALDLLYKKNSIQEEIKKQLHIAKILLQKNLFHQAEKFLRKAKKNIDEFECFEFIPEYAIVQSLLMRECKPDFKSYQQFHLEFSTKLKQSTDLVKSYLYELAAYHYVNDILYKIDKVSSTEIKEFAIIPTSSFRIQANQQFIKICLLDVKQMNITSHKEAHELRNEQKILLKKLYHKFLTNKYLITLHPSLFYSIAGSNIITQIVSGELTHSNEVEQLIEKINAHPVISRIPFLKAKIFLLKVLALTKLSALFFKFPEVFEMLPSIEKKWKKYENDIKGAKKLYYYQLISYTYFAMEEYERSLDSTKAFFINKDIQYLYTDAYWLLIVNHYELGDYYYIQNILPIIRKKLKEEDCFSPPKQHFLHLIENIIKEQDKKNIIAFFRSFVHQIQAYYHGQNLRIAILKEFDFDAYAWALSKIHTTTFLNSISQAYQKATNQ